MKEIIYPTRLKETIASKGNLSYIRTGQLNAPPQPIRCIPDKFSIRAIDINNLNIKKVRMRCYATLNGVPYDYWDFKRDHSEVGYLDCVYVKPSADKPIAGKDILYDYFSRNLNLLYGIYSFFNLVIEDHVNLDKIDFNGITVDTDIGYGGIRLENAVFELSFIPITNLAPDEVDFTMLQWGGKKTFYSCAKIIPINPGQ